MFDEKYSILVAIDFSEASARALSVAAATAERLGAALQLVHVHPRHPADAVLATRDAIVRELVDVREQLELLAAERVPGGVPAHVHLRLGEPVSALLRAITTLKPDLVVVGSHGRGAILRALLGSVSEGVARRSPVPVMVVPSPERAALTAAEPEGPSAQIAWVCRRCAHIRGSLESRRACEACGASPASWEPVPVAEGAVVDAEAPAVGEAPIAVEPAAPTGFGGGVGLTPPGGTAVDVNPELRVRY